MMIPAEALCLKACRWLVRSNRNLANPLKREAYLSPTPLRGPSAVHCSPVGSHRTPFHPPRRHLFARPFSSTKTTSQIVISRPQK